MEAREARRKGFGLATEDTENTEERFWVGHRVHGGHGGFFEIGTGNGVGIRF